MKTKTITIPEADIPPLRNLLSDPAREGDIRNHYATGAVTRLLAQIKQKEQHNE